MCALAGIWLAGCGHAVRPAPSSTVVKPPPVLTGIAACDAYLAGYLSCHRAAGIYSADSLQTHYQAMMQSLLHDASDPLVRPYLKDRCLGLAQQLSTALNGRSCSAAGTAPASR